MQTTPATRPAPARGPDGVFEPLLDEHDYVVDETEGTLPAELRGTLYRNGPGRWEVGGQAMGHLFDGDGMLSMFVLDDGVVRYRNRYVRTNHYLAGRASAGVPQRGIGTLKRGGMLANALRLPANVANTSVVLHAGELLALWEGGKPHTLDPDTLETKGIQSFDGALRWVGAFSAHPKVDPRTGDLFNFGIELVPRPMLRCYRLDAGGRLHHLRDVHIPAAAFNHDVALTERHMVFVIDPITIDLRGLPAVALGRQTFDRALRFRADQGTTVALVPRDGGAPRVLQTESLMHFHVTNAFEDGSDTVVDLVQWDRDWDDVNVELREFRTAGERDLPFGGRLTRLRITPAGRVLREQLSPTTGEFPQYDWRLTGREHRYAYLAAGWEGSAVPNAITKTDHRTGREEAHILPAGHAACEPIFVPCSADAAEDDGWLLTIAYDPAEHRSRLLVLDARDPGAAPLFSARLRHHVPQSFHGTFTSKVARP